MAHTLSSITHRLHELSIIYYSYASRLPKSGETLCGTKFSIGFGGKGSNQCVAAKKLGASTLLVAGVGGDTFGKNYLEELEKFNIHTKHVKTVEGVSTGMAQITVADNGENHIVIVLGANKELSEADVESAADFIINSKVMVCQLEVPESTTIKALKIKASKGKGKSIFNAAPAHSNLNPLLFTLPDIFCVNETEAEIVTGLKVSDPEEAKIAVGYLQGKGCKHVIITLGEDGAVYGDAEIKNFVHVPALKVTAIDTTGAGDAFVGALAYYISSNPEKPIAEIVKLANVAASISVQKYGTQSSFPNLNELPFHNS